MSLGMPTDLKSETARTNGAKSTGPATPEGKARSSQNALKHGLHSKQILLATESAEDFNTLRDSYFDQFEPATPIEAEFVESMAATRWRLRRLATIEANMFSNNLLEKANYFPGELKGEGDEARLAWSFKNIANGGCTLQMLLRYEATLSRTFDRSFKQLQVLQKQRPTKQQNEPTSMSPCPVPSPPPRVRSSTEPRPSGSGQTQPSPHLTHLLENPTAARWRERQSARYSPHHCAGIAPKRDRCAPAEAAWH
jgi:hypothetical protein